jgi:hypothetical protein
MRFEQEINIYSKGAILKRFQTNETNINVAQGKISALISESELQELQNGTGTMYGRFSSAYIDVESLRADFSELSAKYDEASGQYEDLETKVAEYTAGIDGLSTKVSKKVGYDEIISSINQTPESVTISADKINLRGSVTADDIVTNAVTSTKIVSGAIETDKLAANAVTTAKIKAGAVTADQIATNAITADKISAGAITTEKIDSDSITGDKIVAEAITADKIAAKSITANEIASNSITADELSITGGLSSISADIGTITSGVLRSSDYVYTDGNYADEGMEIGLSGTYIRSKNFSVDAGGSVYLRGKGEFEGKITADSGNIGNWTIGEALYSGTTSMTSTEAGTYIGTNGIRNYVSEAQHVDIQNGMLTAKGAEIEGRITTETGTIGGWDINANGISKTSGDYTVHVRAATQSGDHYDYLVVHDEVNDTYPFYVRADGSIYAEKATIGGNIVSTGSGPAWDGSDGEMTYYSIVKDGKFYVSTGDAGEEGDVIVELSYNRLHIESGTAFIGGDITTEGSLYFDNKGTGLTFNTSGGTAGISVLSSGDGVYLWSKNEESSGWDTSVCLVNSSNEVNLVPKTGGTFSGDVTFSTNAIVTKQIKSEGTYNTTRTTAANLTITSAYWIYRYSSSSKRYKHDIEDIRKEDDMDPKGLLNLPVVRYIYNLDYLDKEDLRYNRYVPGFLAEDMAEYYPIAAEYTEDGEIEDWNVRMVVPPMLALIQDAYKEIETLKTELKKLKANG